MLSARITRIVVPLVLAAAFGAIADQGRAAVNLDLRAVAPGPGAQLQADLYAVAGTATTEYIGGLQVALVWNPTTTQGISISSVAGPFAWWDEGFYPDPWHVNDTFTDGDALYLNFADMGQSVPVTEAGLWVARFVFTTVCAGAAPLTVPPELDGARTIVYDGINAGGEITGTVDSMYLVPVPGLGDVNCDGVVDNFDINPFVLALTNADGYVAQYPCCDIDLADCNQDGVLDNFDINPFVALLGR